MWENVGAAVVWEELNVGGTEYPGGVNYYGWNPMEGRSVSVGIETINVTRSMQRIFCFTLRMIRMMK